MAEELLDLEKLEELDELEEPVGLLKKADPGARIQKLQ